MKTEEIRTLLTSGKKHDKVKLLRSLAGGTEPNLIGVVAEHAYLDEAEPDVKAAAELVLKTAAERYTANLSSYFHLIPWDRANLFERDQFEELYEIARSETESFANATKQAIASCLLKHPSTIVVFRMISGYSLNEIAFVLSSGEESFLTKDELQKAERQGTEVAGALLKKWRQNATVLADFFVRSLDPDYLPIPRGIDVRKFKVRTDRYDTRQSWVSVARTATSGVPYGELLYQRYVGGLFRQALDTSSSIKAEILEDPVGELLREAHVPFYKTRFREKIAGWEQAPDFFVPTREAPEVVVEAKVAEDGGTARDKAARIKVLAGIARQKGITLVSFIDGKGFNRINDVLMPILAYSKGLVFTLKNRKDILEVPALRKYLGRAKA